MRTMTHTKIVATVGPACESAPRLRAMIQEGVDILRINASHTTPEGLRHWIVNIRRVTASLRRTVGILVDLQGPRVRTGRLRDGGPVELRRGQAVTIRVSRQPGDGRHITTPCRAFPAMVRPGDHVLLDNGTMTLRIVRVARDRVHASVLVGGRLGENKGINLPNAPATLPALTPKDLADLAVAVPLHVDYLALSFVRREEDVLALQRWLARHRATIPIIAKMEKPGALQHIGPILDHVDGLMVARGDLGIEMGVEKVPAIQKALILQAHLARVPVITATEMLETMIERPHPTRAEVSDVANAVLDGTDAVMLSGETAIGRHPVEAVRTMRRIIREAERHPQSVALADSDAGFPGTSPVHAITYAALYAAHNLGAKAIVVFTRSGKTARLISTLRPTCPIVALTPSERISAQLTLLRGVVPIVIRSSNNTDQMIRRGDEAILRRRVLHRGDPVVVLSGKQALPGARYMTQIHRLGERATREVEG